MISGYVHLYPVAREKAEPFLDWNGGDLLIESRIRLQWEGPFFLVQAHGLLATVSGLFDYLRLRVLPSSCFSISRSVV